MTQQRSQGDYFYGIDLIRFLSALAVAAFHLSWKIPEIAWVMPFGWVGVEVFFVISGLVIANSASGASTRSFAVSRFLRLYPAAWCALLISCTVLAFAPAEPYKLAGIDVIFNFKTVFHSFILAGGNLFIASAYWTLPIELSFYFAVWLLIYFKSFEKVWIFAVALILWSSLYILALALNASGVLHPLPLDLGYGWRNMTLLRHGIYFGLGILIWSIKEARITAMGRIAMAVALLFSIVEIYCRASQSTFMAVQVRIVSVAVFLVAFGAIVLSVKYSQSFPRNEALRRLVRILGLTTYPFYLLHETVGGFVLCQAKRLGLSYSATLWIALLSVFAVSLAVAVYFEPALRNWLKRTFPALNRNPAATT